MADGFSAGMTPVVRTCSDCGQVTTAMVVMGFSLHTRCCQKNQRRHWRAQEALLLEVATYCFSRLRAVMHAPSSGRVHSRRCNHPQPQTFRPTTQRPAGNDGRSAGQPSNVRASSHNDEDREAVQVPECTGSNRHDAGMETREETDAQTSFLLIDLSAMD